MSQADFADQVLGVNEVTVYRYLHGGTIPKSKMRHLERIEAIARDGAYLTVVYRTYGTTGLHHKAMVRQRAQLQTGRHNPYAAFGNALYRRVKSPGNPAYAGKKEIS